MPSRRVVGIDWIERGRWVMLAMGHMYWCKNGARKNTNIWGFSVHGSEILSPQWAARSPWE